MTCAAIVDEAEKRWRASGSVDTHDVATLGPTSHLPGDGLLLATSALGVGATAVGLGVALAGRALRWPRLFDGVEAVRGGRRLPAAAAPPARGPHRPLGDGQRAVGGDGGRARRSRCRRRRWRWTSLMEILKAAEYQAEARAWRRHEPALARHAEQPEVHPPSRPVPPPAGPVERHAGARAGPG